MKISLFLFCLLDIIFVGVFSVSCFADFKDVTLLIVIVAVVIFTYWPLWTFYQDMFKKQAYKDKKWMVRNQSFCVFYILSRILLLFIYGTVAIIETADIEVWYTIKHLPLEVKISFGLLCGILVVVIFIYLLFIAPTYEKILVPLLEEMHVMATVHHSNGLKQEVIYNDMSGLDMKSAHRVMLVPGTPQSGNHAHVITRENI
jgi:hypothetical protein